METDIFQRLERLEQKLDVVIDDVSKTRRYLQIITWVTVIMIVLPAIGLVVVIPLFINMYTALA